MSHVTLQKKHSNFRLVTWDNNWLKEEKRHNIVKFIFATQSFILLLTWDTSYLTCDFMQIHMLMFDDSARKGCKFFQKTQFLSHVSLRESNITER